MINIKTIDNTYFADDIEITSISISYFEGEHFVIRGQTAHFGNLPIIAVADFPSVKISKLNWQLLPGFPREHWPETWKEEIDDQNTK